MLALKYLLMIAGLALFGSTGALVVYDVYLAEQLRRILNCKPAGVRRGVRTDSLVSSTNTSRAYSSVSQPEKANKRTPSIAPHRAAFSSGRA
ncbi:MAG TPA: hypothetical protein VJN93_17265 [Candidatus Acidoferrum sp.]|nr:hypothetical protein [Candidatus Acidoferrum sp.]